MKAIDLLPKDEFIDEWCGFTVYDAETGDPVINPFYHPLIEGFGYDDYNGNSEFALTNNGQLIFLYMHSDRYIEANDVEKKGLFLIQFADGKYMRW